MNTINLGKVRGNMIYTGGAVVGSSAAGVIFDATGIEKAYEGDIYINLDSSSIYNGNVYECVTPGSPDIAKWIYKGSIRGPKVSTVNNLKSTSTEDALAAYQGTRLFDMMINAGVFSKNVIVDCDQIVYGLKVVIDNVDSVLTLVVGGIEYKYNHISSGTAENTKISIVLGENIGMPQSGGVINEIRSTEAYIYAYELTDASATTIYSKNIDLWDAINEALLSHEITGQVIDGEETLAMGSIHKFVNGLKKVFYPITHAKAVWFDKANKKTVHDVITEMLSGSDNGNISDEYDENVIYEAGTYCIRENVLYKALGTTTGEFDANMWEACKVDEEIGVLKNDVSELNKNIADLIINKGKIPPSGSATIEFANIPAGCIISHGTWTNQSFDFVAFNYSNGIEVTTLAKFGEPLITITRNGNNLILKNTNEQYKVPYGVYLLGGM